MKRIKVMAVFLVSMGALALVLYSLKQGKESAGAPAAFRTSFLMNEAVSRILFSAKRQSVKKSAPLGKAPRVNGDIGLRSPINIADYKIRVESGSTQLALNVTEIKLLPKSEYATDFRCIEGWSEETQYAGLRFRDFMQKYQLGKKADGTYYAYVGLETPDKQYYVSIDMESMLHDQTVLAYEMNGMPLSEANGFPLRLIIPIKYGIKSLKRIGRIYFSDHRPPDYWAERGYDWYSGL